MHEEFDEAGGQDLERLCQGVSPSGEPCDYPPTVHCARAEKRRSGVNKTHDGEA